MNVGGKTCRFQGVNPLMTGFYMIAASVMKELNRKIILVYSVNFYLLKLILSRIFSKWLLKESPNLSHLELISCFLKVSTERKVTVFKEKTYFEDKKTFHSRENSRLGKILRT